MNNRIRLQARALQMVSHLYVLGILRTDDDRPVRQVVFIPCDNLEEWKCRYKDRLETIRTQCGRSVIWERNGICKGYTANCAKRSR